MNCLVFGAGAVGLGLASCLLKNGVDVSLIVREDTARALQENGLRRDGIFGSFYAESNSFTVMTSLEDAENRINFDVILICTKSFDSCFIAELLSKQKSILAKNSIIVLCQNGWGNAEIFYQYFPHHIIFNARIITGFMRNKKNEVVVTVHADAIHLGSLSGTENKLLGILADSITAGGIPCNVVSDIVKDLWAKMLYNCALNPLGSIFQVPYGKLGDCPETKDIMDAIVREIFLVMTKSGYKTHWDNEQAYRQKFYQDLLPKTKYHLSSMLQDIRSGKRTEIDALNGAVINIAEKHSIAVPANEIIFKMIKFMEKKAGIS